MIINGLIFNAELEDIIDELQAQLSINHIPLLQKRKDLPDDIMVSCPYHKDGQEKRPSAGLKKSDGTFHCFACGETHSLQEFISHCFGYGDDLVGAFGWNWLLKNFLTVSVENRKDIEIDFGRGQLNTKNTKTYISEEELDSYRFYHPYMWKRKMTPEVVDIFDIGYDRNSQCITFPIRDENGNTLFIARRSVNTKYFNYPLGAEKPVYGLFELKQHQLCPDGSKMSENAIIVCESMIDAITCWVYGKPAVALNGLGNDLQFKQLNELPNRKLILATDADQAGMKARQRIKAHLKNKIVTEYVWDVKDAKDINDMSKEQFLNLEEVF